MQKIREAVILAAGEGTRLRPTIGEMPKSMLQFNGKPLLEHILNALRERGVKIFTIVVNYKKERIQSYFGDGSRFNLEIHYVTQKNSNGGTADAVGMAEGNIKDAKFFVVYGDNVFDPEILDEILSKVDSYDGVLCGKEMKDVTQYGTFKIEEDLVKEIAEKSPNPPSNIVFTGLMILPVDIFNAIKETQLSKRGEKELTSSISILASKNSKIGYVSTTKFWMDPRNKEDLESIGKFYRGI